MIQLLLCILMIWKRKNYVQYSKPTELTKLPIKNQHPLLSTITMITVRIKLILSYFSLLIIILFPARRATQFYSAKKAYLCDICEEDDCGEVCKIRALKRISERSEKSISDAKDETSKDNASKFSSPVLIIFLIAITRIFLIRI